MDTKVIITSINIARFAHDSLVLKICDRVE